MLRPAAHVFLLLSLPVAAGAVVPITDCATVVPPRETGVLQNDLDCTGVSKRCLACDREGCVPTAQVCTDDSECPPNPPPALPACRHPASVVLRTRATLDMNGHSIVAASNCTAVACTFRSRRCTVTSSTGRGDISGALVGVFPPSYGGKLVISNVDVHGCSSGIVSPNIAAVIEATDVTANDNLGGGIRGRKVVANGVTANNNGGRGISAEGGGLRGENITVSDNGDFGAVSYRRYKLDNFTATGNGFAVPEGSGAGLWSLSGGTLDNSTLTGNVYQTASGPTPMDLLSGGRPRLENTTCDNSGGKRFGTPGPGGLIPWGVCAND